MQPDQDTEQPLGDPIEATTAEPSEPVDARAASTSTTCVRCTA